MTITEMIRQLEAIREEQGDIEVWVDGSGFGEATEVFHSERYEAVVIG